MTTSAPGTDALWGWKERSALVLATSLSVVCASLPASTPFARAAFVASSLAGVGLVLMAWRRGGYTTSEVLGMAVVLRLIAFPLLPSLSDDAFRYLWDGLLQLEGRNPYLSRPESLGEWFHVELFPLLNSVSYYTVYPPASQVVFALGGLASKLGWPAGWYTIKALFVGLELSGVWALSRLVSARHLALYAWHPLAVLEVAGQGHTEAGLVGGLLVSYWAYRRNRPALSVAALTLAGWFKLYPFLLLPFLLRRVGWRYSALVIAISVVVAAPYASSQAVSNVLESLDLYVRSFEFNAGFYFALKQAWFAVAGTDASKTLGPALRGVFLLVTALLFMLPKRTFPLIWNWLFVLCLFWVTTTTVHPWYLLSVLALLPITLGQTYNQPDTAPRWHALGWLALSASSLGTYMLYADAAWAYWAFVIVGWTAWAGCMTVAFTASVLPRIMRRRARSKWDWLQRHVEPESEMLDLGAGEGYVGACAVRQSGASVTLADVIDLNRTELPHVLYGGDELSFADRSFDVTLLVFVLHHTEHASRVIAEAKRVTRKRVLVVESVYRSAPERYWLTAADRLANRLRSSGKMDEQEHHLKFRTAGEWRTIFEGAGFRVAYEDTRGTPLHRQHLFVLDIE